MMQAVRAAETPYEHALNALLHGTDPPEGVDDSILAATEAALSSYDVEGVRRLFDACLIGLATADELAACFDVTLEETAAYTHLFFDMSVFGNAFHTITWIGEMTDEATRALLKEAHTKGFRAIRFRYASERDAPTTVETLQRVLEADARAYTEQQHLPLSDTRTKELRALGKQVLASANILTKVTEDKPEDEASGDAEFVIQPRAANPTLEDLVARGVVIVQ